MISAFNQSKCTHTPGAVGSRHCGARGAVGGSVPCSRVSPQSWTLSARAGIRTHNLGLLRVSSPMLYPLDHDCPNHYKSCPKNCNPRLCNFSRDCIFKKARLLCRYPGNTGSLQSQCCQLLQSQCCQNLFEKSLNVARWRHTLISIFMTSSRRIAFYVCLPLCAYILYCNLAKFSIKLFSFT